MTTLTAPNLPTGKALRAGLWIAQILLAVLFCGAGLTKLTTPIPELSQMMPWTGAWPAGFVRFIALVDLAGGLGVLLPALTRIQPRLTVLAALGCVVLQVLAIVLHVSRAEWTVLPLNALLMSLSVFVLWGRGKRVPIDPRA